MKGMCELVRDGSSPHTWGIPIATPPIWYRGGGSVHPHIRGAYSASSKASCFRTGSSPHTWGIRMNPVRWARDMGSSPHTWGIRCWALQAPSENRFIPTYVGHTPIKFFARPTPAVHPHIRGAYPNFCFSALTSVGSSPHTWGIHPVFQSSQQARRFIPTYVGHTKKQGNKNIVPAVHPHIRGAYLRKTRGSAQKHGSSPHTWGIHWTAVRKMAGFSHFSYDFTRKSYFVQGLVFFGVIGAEAFPTHRRGRIQCLPGAHGGSVRNL